MAQLVVQHPPEPTGVAPDGRLAVGRDADNDVVIDHPTVSRHHAIIQRINGHYFITDMASRNGTRLNGRTVCERRPLVHGDKIRFGQMRVTFHVSADVSVAPSFERAQGQALEPGILFDCLCGTRLWAKAEAVSGIVTCRQCFAEVVVPEQSAGSDWGETVSGMVLSTAPSSPLPAPVQAGTCSICQWTTSSADHITSCPSCRLMFHTECWAENGGCSACAQVKVLPPFPAESVFNPALERMTTPPELSVEPMATTHTISIDHALLAAGVVGGVLGLLLFGAPSLVTLIMAFVIGKRHVYTHAWEPVLLLAAGVSLLGAVAGAAVSSIVWFGWSPGASF